MDPNLDVIHNVQLLLLFKFPNTCVILTVLYSFLILTYTRSIPDFAVNIINTSQEKVITVN